MWRMGDYSEERIASLLPIRKQLFETKNERFAATRFGRTISTLSDAVFGIAAEGANLYAAHGSEVTRLVARNGAVAI